MQLNQGKCFAAITCLLLVFSGCKKEEPLELSPKVEQSPKADFFFIITNPGTLPAVVNFSSVSAHADTFKWEFDNGTISTLEKPTTRYTENKVFRVKLIVSNSVGKDSITRAVQIHKGHRPDRNILFPTSKKEPI